MLFFLFENLHDVRLQGALQLVFGDSTVFIPVDVFDELFETFFDLLLEFLSQVYLFADESLFEQLLDLVLFEEAAFVSVIKLEGGLNDVSNQVGALRHLNYNLVCGKLN